MFLGEETCECTCKDYHKNICSQTESQTQDVFHSVLRYDLSDCRLKYRLMHILLVLYFLPVLYDKILSICSRLIKTVLNNVYLFIWFIVVNNTEQYTVEPE